MGKGDDKPGAKEGPDFSEVFAGLSGGKRPSAPETQAAPAPRDTLPGVGLAQESPSDTQPSAPENPVVPNDSWPTVFVVNARGKDTGEEKLASTLRRSSLNAEVRNLEPGNARETALEIKVTAPDAVALLAGSDPSASVELARSAARMHVPVLFVLEKDTFPRDLFMSAGEDDIHKNISVLHAQAHKKEGRAAISERVEGIISGAEKEKAPAPVTGQAQPLPSISILDFSDGGNGANLEAALKKTGFGATTKKMSEYATGINGVNPQLEMIKHDLRLLKPRPGALAVIAPELPDNDSKEIALFAAKELGLPVVYMRTQENTPLPMKELMRRNNIALFHQPVETKEGCGEISRELETMVRIAQQAPSPAR